MNTKVKSIFTSTLWIMAFIGFAEVAIAADKQKQPVLYSINNDSMNKEIEKQMASLDSMTKRMEFRLDSQQLAQEMERNNKALDDFMRAKREQDEKAKKALIIRGSFFAVMLVLVVANVIRRRKKKKDGTT